MPNVPLRAHVTNLHAAELRRLRNRIHELEQGSFPLRSEIQGLQQDLRRMTQKYEDAQRRADACEDAFGAMVSALHEIRLASGKAAV